jgi:hypothetical protein
MSDPSGLGESSWANNAVDQACERAAIWYQSLPRFPQRVNLGSVVGARHPALLSEQDCVIHFARFLEEVGVPWDAIHHQISMSRWLFEPPHPAAAAGVSKWRWKVDLALLRADDFLAADLPATDLSFMFDAFLEFKYLSDFWTLDGVHPYGEPAKGREAVKKDVEKIGRYLAGSACRTGYVIVFAECDWGFSPTFVSDAEANFGCRVRFVRGYSTTADLAL